jgi:hypothetical protein
LTSLYSGGIIISETEIQEDKTMTNEYRLLSRMAMDCNYFLGAGNRHEKFLWAGNVKDHIKTMKDIWNSLKVKPEWLTMEQIEAWEKEMEG